MPEKTNVARLFCPLSDWKTRKATRGRGAGREYKFRYFLGFDQRQWMIGEMYQDSRPYNAQKFYAKMEHVLPAIKDCFGEDCAETALFYTNQALGINPPVCKGENQWREVGRKIDQSALTNFNSPAYDDLNERLMKNHQKME